MEAIKLKSYLKIAAECLRDLGEIPAGHLYASLMCNGVTLPDYQIIEDCLCKVLGVKKDRSHMLTWTKRSETIFNKVKAQVW